MRLYILLFFLFLASCVGEDKNYKIVALHSKKVLTLSYNRALQTISDTTNTPHKWYIQPFSDSTVSLISLPTEEAIELAEIMDQVLPYLSPRDSNNVRQRFKLDQNSDGSISIVSAYSGYCIDIASSEMEDFAVITTWPREDYPNQQWNIITTDEGVLVSSRLNDKLLAPTPALHMDGANVGQWPFEDRPEQRWKIKEQEDGSFLIQNVFSGTYLQESDGSLSLQHNVHMHSDKTSNRSHWQMVESKNNGVKIRNQATGLCMDVRDAFPYDGANVMTYDCDGGADNQFWLLEEVR